MAVSDRGEMSGSVSGGCVETAVVQEALVALKDGRPRRLHYGVTDEAAWEIGLTCGGQIEVFVQPLGAADRLTADDRRLLDSLAERQAGVAPIVRALVIDGPDEVLGAWSLIAADGSAAGRIPPAALDQLAPEARAALRTGTAQIRSCNIEGRQLEVLLDPSLPPPTLVIVGGVHIAMVLSRLAHTIGYRVIVIDPRTVFTTAERFPEVDAIDHSWPDEGLRKAGLTPATAVAILSHDPKLDDPALLVALRSPAFYVGALGSAESQAQRRARLLAAGLTEAEVGRLRGPIGLDLGRHDPESIALGILAEIVATRAGVT
jgi:xanthine dehydrogenase accessory factor